MSKFAIGIDFGTLSARALLVDVETGREIAAQAFDYPHGVLDRALPDGLRLGADWALQHPGDWTLALRETVRGALQKSRVSPADVIGLGLDFTACTLLPVDANLTPLMEQPTFADNPYAWPMLWKHHAAQACADCLNEVAAARSEPFLARYGGKISSESLHPKLMQIFAEAPEVFEAADQFLEAGDYMVQRLTGYSARSMSLAGYKALWSPEDGYPSADFLDACLPGFARSSKKLRGPVLPVGAKAGELTERAAHELGLLPGTAVAVSNIDAHVSLPGAGISETGTLIMIMGTSNCHVMLSKENRIVPGMCGAVRDGVVPGYIGYEMNQMMGDVLQWFVSHAVPAEYAKEAEAQNLSLHNLLTEKAAKLKVGESGLLALDWLGGNRSVLVDGQLSGLILGLTTTTRPEEIYRALIEGTAFGARVIFDTFTRCGLPVERVRACGGVAHKNPFLMQLYADTLNREISIVPSTETPALGSAMFGATAAGAARGGYDRIEEAVKAMSAEPKVKYVPNPEHARAYDQLYREYVRLHDYFGRGENDVMKRLKRMRAEGLKS